MSLDMAKAYDSIDWNYMSAMLKHMGFGDMFMTWISLLYSRPKAAIRLGTSVSSQFAVGRGTQQECPLSPSLFALVMEPLAIALRNSPDVKALGVGGIRECTALYADDMLLFLQDPGPSLEAVFEILDEFSCFSGLCVNWEKSNVMVIDMGALALATKAVSISWVSQFKYIGIHISPRISDFMSLYLPPLLAKVKIQLDAWRHLPLSYWKSKPSENQSVAGILVLLMKLPNLGPLFVL